ncbi:hypothetical protein EVAR_59661_1 [Eumeta japonica]|uniref:Uncharacterized protein n=1 Tax=Eumeta variegata TaxID=151549 RepID=A0A4C1Z3C8_EUMVA|nr:hypothetical protein EVAR_59661_1 [Eumeta japonica]
MAMFELQESIRPRALYHRRHRCHANVRDSTSERAPRGTDIVVQLDRERDRTQYLSSFEGDALKISVLNQGTAAMLNEGMPKTITCP